MARRAGRALAASLALAAIGMPAALLASQAPAAAEAGKRLGSSQAKIAIIGMTPQQAGPGVTITVTGTITNTSHQPISELSVHLLGSSTPVSTSAELQPGSTGQDVLASTPLPHGIWKSKGALQPGSTHGWTIAVKANSIGMTKFGVYPLTAQAETTQAQSTPGQTTPVQLSLAATTTYLPYVPAKKGPYGSSIPTRTKISWVLPLIDKPLLGQPWQDICQGAQAGALAASVGSGGRLDRLVAAGGDSMGTAEAYSAAVGSRRTAQNRAIRSEPAAQRLSSYDGITWAIDPALLANVEALSDCGSSQPRWASAAQNWLTGLRRVTSAEPVFVTPYADPDVAALVSHRLSGDVGLSFELGQNIGQQILHRSFEPSTANAPASGAQSQATDIAWPADGIFGYSTVEFLAAQAAIRTLLLSRSALPAEQSTVLRVTNGAGGYTNVLLADNSLTQLLGSGGSTAGSAFATAQDFLAQTALAVQRHPGTPVIVAPPRRFDPAPGLTADLLAETASARWLSPVALTSLTTGRHIPDVPNPAWASSRARIGRRVLRRLGVVDYKIAQLQSMAAVPSDSLSLAASTVESSAWQGQSRTTALAMLRALTSQIAKQEHDVQVYAEPRVTLGGLKGNVPVSIDNRLGYAVQVRLQLRYSQDTGVKVTAEPSGPVRVPAHTAVTVRLHVQATEVGSTTITMSLLNRSGQMLPAQSQSMIVEATQVGVLGVIICAAALGVFLIAYAARAVRHGRPDGSADQPADLGPAADQARDHSTDPAEADTVMAERTELGTAGAPGP